MPPSREEGNGKGEEQPYYCLTGTRPLGCAMGTYYTEKSEEKVAESAPQELASEGSSFLAAGYA